MPRIWLSLGSNIDRRRNLGLALEALEKAFGELVRSRVYESEAIGFEGAPFLNMVVGAQTALPVPELMTLLRGIEAERGRVRSGERFGPRTLDIDLLTYGDSVASGDGVELPRDEILRYAFVLRPLAEVAGQERHPRLGLSYRELWQRFDARGQPLRPLDGGL